MNFKKYKLSFYGVALALGLLLQGCSDAAKALNSVTNNFGSNIDFGNLSPNSVNVQWASPNTGLKGATATYDFRIVGATASGVSVIQNLNSANEITNTDPTVGPFVVVDWEPNNNFQFDTELEKYTAGASNLTPDTQYYFAIYYRDYCAPISRGVPECDDGEVLDLRTVTTLTNDSPTVGKGGLFFQEIIAGGVTLNWTRAYINNVGPSPIEYKVVKALNKNQLDTVALANAITGNNLLVNWQTEEEINPPTSKGRDPYLNVSGLTVGQNEFFTVLARVRDGNSGIYLYNPRRIPTPNVEFELDDDELEDATLDNENIGSYQISGYCEFIGTENVSLTVAGNTQVLDCEEYLCNANNADPACNGNSKAPSGGIWRTYLNLADEGSDALDIADGEVSVSVTHTNPMGISSVKTDSFIKNTVRPEVTITTPANIDDNNVNNYSISGTCSANDYSVYLGISGENNLKGLPSANCIDGAWTISELSLSGYSDGQINFTAYHRNQYNNAEPAEASAIKTTTPPTSK